ncbi:MULTISPECIES: LysM peptidoglycan-binding domain-containing protein [unclassified Synechococcus]|uniref:LysM peptidoglycan-binding domain-containing protein n=1 Tax=unclassified Synechococcus TaxID=2626047 RepID=UPI0000698FDD|nr:MULTISPECIES: LysM peptidoglycan-binding domain-containing protein [unclassified Synechococcus]EAQ74198.1 Peptidoglycan-binding LysM [Synechococcus sp. WH 5701]WFN59994.1 LysM peptidoglycan-binding domain-containing protein [Synechococcus sp. CCFWC 502]
MRSPQPLRRALAALVVALVLPLPALAGPQHVVKSGETLSEIAERYGVSVKRLLQLNGIKDPNLVEAGTRLKLPEGSPAQASHTVSAGETLSEIAERYGLSVQKLMELNGLKDADLVQVGQRLKVPTAKSAASPAKPAKPAAPAAAGAKTGRVHVVKSGETLSEIAERYDVPMARLVSMNKLESPDNLQVGTKLSLGAGSGTPATKPAPAKPAAAKPAASKPAASKPAAAKPAPAPQAAAPKPAAKPEPKPAPNPPEQAEQPAPAVATPAAQATPEPEAKPAAAAPKPTVAAAQPQPKPKPKPKPDPSNTAPPDWRTYGPLQVDFSNWRPMGGSQVAPALNSGGQPVFVAINCAARKINATGEAGAWTSWEDPTTDFEEQLIKDVCKQTAG